MSNNTVTLDVRLIPHSERSPRKVLDVWEKLEPGGTLRLINDHDPKTLYNLFQGQYKDSFDWVYSEQGPVDWVINITKLKK